MSHVISLRLRDEQVERTRRVARRMNRTVSETAALLREEALRMTEYAFIQFRDSPAGRQAYIQGSGLAVWEVVLVARSYGDNVARTAAHFGWPEPRVRAALNYAAAYPDEISAAIMDNRVDFAALSRMLPNAQQFSPDRPEDGAESASVVEDTGA